MNSVITSRFCNYSAPYHQTHSFPAPSPPSPPPNPRTHVLWWQPSASHVRSPKLLTYAPARFSFKAVASSSGDPPSKALQLRRILESPGVHQGPACFDALSAKLVEEAGFRYRFTSGFSISASRLVLPDVGYLSYGVMLDQAKHITQAVLIPVIGDGDNGYGNGMNVKRTVKGFIEAGFAGIIIEDQYSVDKVFPKACGHNRGRKVVPREDAVVHIKAALDAQKESGSDIVIVARTDSCQAVSLEEALWRSQTFSDIGADVLFIDALASREEMKAVCEVSPSLPKMANMLEGRGKTPIFCPGELEEIGYKLVAYPLSLIGVSIRAMQKAAVSTVHNKEHKVMQSREVRVYKIPSSR